LKELGLGVEKELVERIIVDEEWFESLCDTCGTAKIATMKPHDL